MRPYIMPDSFTLKRSRRLNTDGFDHSLTCPCHIALSPTPISGALGSGWGNHLGWCKSEIFFLLLLHSSVLNPTADPVYNPEA
jgi:hypothetical protein